VPPRDLESALAADLRLFDGALLRKVLAWNPLQLRIAEGAAQSFQGARVFAPL
jgi:hypothetical protein